MAFDPAIARCFAHEFRRHGKPETTIQLIPPADVREIGDELALRRAELAAAQEKVGRALDKATRP